MLAANVFEKSKINNQISKHWNKFHNLLKDKEAEVEHHYKKKSKKLKK
jgi:hypothetical protein